MTDYYPLASVVESTRILSLGAVDMHDLELWWYGKHSLLSVSYDHLPHSRLYGDTVTHGQWVGGMSATGTRLELYG